MRSLTVLAAGSALLPARTASLGTPVSMGATFKIGGPVPKTAAARRLICNELTDLGIGRFKENCLTEAITMFDEALRVRAEDPPYLLHRGLCLYYLDRFDDASSQFERDASRFQERFDDFCCPTEEVIWCAVSTAREEPAGLAALQQKDALLPVGKEDRPVFRALYEMFKGRLEPPPSPELLKIAGEDRARLFYAYLYTGLYYEAKGVETYSREYIQRASALPYARVDEAMGALSRIHLRRRGWLDLEQLAARA